MATKRTCWVFCPQCRHDLNGDDKSFVIELGSMVTYRCASCGHISRFFFDAPVPIYQERHEQ